MSSSKPDMTTTAGRIEDLRNRLEEAQAPVGQDAIDAVPVSYTHLTLPTILLV